MMTDEPYATRPARKTRSPNRRGVVSLWTILVLPVLVILFAVVVEGVHLWLARVELENGLEAAALAAVKDWAESGATPGLGWTDIPRTIGQEYAAANTINQTQIGIDKNLAPGPYDAANPNENRTCDIDADGHLIFGAITEEDPYVFEADVAPSCGAIGNVLFDVSSQNPGGDDNTWGISFRTSDDPVLNQTLVIRSVIYNANPDNAPVPPLRFDFTTSGPCLSRNLPGPKVDDGAKSQNDNVGFYDWPSVPAGNPPANGVWPVLTDQCASSPQIVFIPTAGITETLQIDFSSGFGDDGFSPGDRFRFGANLQRRRGNSSNFATASGDDVADIMQVTVFFGLIVGGVVQPFPADGTGTTVTFLRSDARSQDCQVRPLFIDDLGQEHVVVHPDEIVDLPCPETSSNPNANNNGQSYVELAGGGALRYYAVRAQARHQVPSLICGFCGVNFGPFYVGACTTAMYDCGLQRPRLIRVEPENYYCP